MDDAESGQSKERIDISIIVPLYNEEENVCLLYEGIDAVARNLSRSYEIIFVDDGSSDDTVSIARDLAAKDPHLRLIIFRRNYGQTPAMAAGIDHAYGSTLITMDGDLQNDPADIPAMLEKLEEGYDIVAGWRHKRQDKAISRKLPSKIANWLIGKVTGVPIKDNGCSLKVYRAEVIKHVPLYSEMHRFIPAMASIAGARVCEMKVRHHARRFGESKYGLSRIYRVLLDLLVIKTIVSSISQPLRWFAMFGAGAALIGIIAVIWGVVVVIQYQASLFVPAGVALLFFVLASSLMLWGVLAELVYRTGSLRLDMLALLNASQCRKNKGTNL
jgi:glycosyltransferase involved in cell wall biosynthesis